MLTLYVAHKRVPTGPRELLCGVCGKDFVAKRSDAKVCSPACRQKSYRQRKLSH